MKVRQIVIAAVAIIIIACNKDKFTTTPQVEIKSISPENVNSGNLITVKGKYTDKEGNLDSALVVYKWYNNAIVTRTDTFRYSFDQLGLPPKTIEADIELVFEYNTFNTDFAKLGGVSQDTTATLGMILKDKDSLRSNYTESARIRLLKP
ncbi:hypothetical protein CAP36_13555 [Chitinophagaceae bacterium IBVUCB2]|nr:hypothetical protein CAP36_13555 [Chitinophagaceae bacterium IBVUCB2]